MEQKMIKDNTLGIGEWDDHTLKTYDDARDLSIHLTDKILNNFGRDKDDYYHSDADEKGITIPFDDERNNPGSKYSWELQDLITAAIAKRFNVKK